ncbi:MAG: hypothetical protein CMD04_02540 [Flavobacteriales bacterium]|nr:hypothetical protein [Flavobacteriales bacterium]
MKNMKKLLLTICLLTAGIITSNAQIKLGYINSYELLSIMPESATMQADLQSYAKGLEGTLEAMQAEYEKKVTDYQQNEVTYTDLVKQDKIIEIENLQKRILEFQQSAQQEINEKEQAMMSPIIEKARKAIQQVAEEGNYVYIFDAKDGNIIHADENQNILPLVKAKLGL